MQLHRIISYGLMTAGAVVSARAGLKRHQWEETNIHAGIVLDWDDVQAVVTRAAGGMGEGQEALAELLGHYRKHGATHLSLPELTLNRLLSKGEISLTQGSSPQRLYLQTPNNILADRVVTELEARLPHLKPIRSGTKTPTVSFLGDLPTVAEVGLGFDPTQAALAHHAGLVPVARPIGYSWVQPEMIARTLDQAAALGAKIVAVQGNLIPGHEFQMEHTVEAMRRNRLTYAYFSESRHQKGDWFLAKNLAQDGRVILAHEFQPEELLEEDWHTAAYRWATLATEAGIRLCCVRFFRVLHAADPLESLAYVQELTQALDHAGLLVSHAGQVDLTVFQPERDDRLLACAGLGVAGAIGLAVDWLPLPEQVKLLGVGGSALALSGLPFLEKRLSQRQQGENHGHERHEEHAGHAHDHEQQHHHPSDEHDHPHDHGHHHHEHGHSHGPAHPTAYASKGLALAAVAAFPTAATAINGGGPLSAAAQAVAVSLAGTAVLSATTAEADYVLGVETYRGYNLDWLIPLGVTAASFLLGRPDAAADDSKSHLPPPTSHILTWLPLVGLALAAIKSLTGGQDTLARLDREHRHAHTHHLSAFQRAMGDSKMALSPRPLQKWALLGPLGTIIASIMRQHRQDELAVIALTAAAAGQVASLTGFRNGQRPLLKTLEGRAKGWGIGVVLAGLFWIVFSLVRKEK